jgi:hypothetical protein
MNQDTVVTIRLFTKQGDTRIQAEMIIEEGANLRRIPLNLESDAIPMVPVFIDGQQVGILLVKEEPEVGQ